MGTYGDDNLGKPVSVLRHCYSSLRASLPRFKNDMLQWVLEEAVSRGSPDYEIVERVMLVNFSATHTVSVVRD